MTRRTAHEVGSVIHDLRRPSILGVRALTPEECAARDEWPRPGILLGGLGLDDSLRRTFTQDETDTLIRRDLIVHTEPGERHELARIVGAPCDVVIKSTRCAGLHVAPVSQRGGIDTDPLVRLLAYRAWGDRDRRWFADRGVRKGDRVTG
jgi:hypothetical protein